MMNFLRKHMRKIFVVTIIAFVGGTFVGGGAYLFGPANDFKTAATVNGEKIPMNIFNAIYTHYSEIYRRQAEDTITEEQFNQLKVKTLQALVQEELFYQKSLEYSMIVSDDELRNDLQTTEMFLGENRAFNPQRYYAFLNSIRMTPKEYEGMRKKQIAGEKLKVLLVSSIKVGSLELEEAKQENPEIKRSDLAMMKANAILNEWYINIARNSKISTNDMIFK